VIIWLAWLACATPDAPTDAPTAEAKAPATAPARCDDAPFEAADTPLALARVLEAAPPAACDRALSRATTRLIRRTEEDFSPAAEPLGASCAAGRGGACWLLGMLHLHGLLGEADRRAGRAAMTRSCDAGWPSACFALYAYVSADTTPEQELSLRARGCAQGAGVYEACMKQLNASSGPPRAALAERVLATLNARCEAGDADDCRRAADWLDDGVFGVEADPPRARALAAAGCEAGEVDMCSRLLRYASADGDDATRQGAEARLLDLHRSRCAESPRVSCQPLLRAYQAGGMGLDPDPAARAAILQAGCEAGAANACAQLAAGAHQGRDGPPDVQAARAWGERASALYDARCAAHRVTDCEAAARLHGVWTDDSDRGRLPRVGLAASDDPVAAYRARACALGSARACQLMGEDGLRRGCEALDDGPLCFRLARARSGAEAEATLWRSCRLRYPGACAKLAESDAPPPDLEAWRVSACSHMPTPACRERYPPGR